MTKADMIRVIVYQIEHETKATVEGYFNNLIGCPPANQMCGASYWDTCVQCRNRYARQILAKLNKKEAKP